MNENAIEWLRGDSVVTVTLCSNSRYNSKVRKLAKEHPEDVQICDENADGSIVAHLPLKYIKISVPKKLSEEQIEKLTKDSRERMISLHAKRKQTII